MVDPDSVHRTAKMLADSGEAASLAEADAELARYVLQVDVGTGVGANRTLQAIAVTTVNTAARAFLGRVRVRIGEDPVLQVGWDAGSRLSEAVQRHGGVIVAALREDLPTICIGQPRSDVRGRPVLRATFDGWTAGVVEGVETPLAERDFFIPAGVAAAGIAVAEAFQHRRGDLRAGRRRQGISLWRPDLDWLDREAVGPDDIDLAPNRWWLIGLGHLGQAYLWTIGLLPYTSPETVTFMLQDDDRITKANESTGLLTPPEWIDRRKTRALAELLEARGFKTAISERRLASGHGPVADEPRLGLAGVDNPETRAGLSDAGFEIVVDAGLGAGPLHYLDILTHTFPAGRRSDEIPGWRDARTPDDSLLDRPAYRKLAAETGDQCGTVEVAGRSVAAAFVGAVAGALVVAEAIRYVAGEHRYVVMDASLRDLSAIGAVLARNAPPAGNPGFARLN